MINVTTRIAVEITNLPTFELSWDDITPQMPLSSLSIDDLLPSAEDGRRLYDRASKYVKHFVVRNFPALKGLKNLTEPGPSSEHPKSNIIPMPMLQRDEKYMHETIAILHDYRI
jgi:hypothetical protein